MPRHNLMRKVRQDGRVIAATGHLHLSTFRRLIYPAAAVVAVAAVAVVVVVVAAAAVVDTADAVNIYRRH